MRPGLLFAALFSIVPALMMASPAVAALAAQESSVDPGQTASPPALPRTLEAQIMQAAGFTRRGSEWVNCEGDGTGSIEQFRDLNADGSEEAMVMSYGTGCHGMTGQGFVLLARQGAGWKVVAESTGIPALYPRSGIAWPDIEIGGPGFDCFRFLRWDGRAYVDGGTSLEGRFCSIAARFEPSVKRASALSLGSPEFGFMGRIPMRLGYYGLQDVPCARAGSFIKFERDGYWEIFGPGRDDAYHTAVGDIIEAEEGYFSLVPDESTSGEPLEEGEPESGLILKPVYPGAIEVVIQDTADMTFCPADQVPQRMRR
ncbi:hypothetical protein [Qipengyuania sp. MTN3-11]|uniref:hypothetical protein n=1 Tax=Qipengyuania sp. MTN3-11 TaxID=3056557 RepID=UPI0036F2C4BF